MLMMIFGDDEVMKMTLVLFFDFFDIQAFWYQKLISEISKILSIHPSIKSCLNQAMHLMIFK